MVTALLKKTIPDKLLTKALFNDLNYCNVSLKHHRLAWNLNFGWEMSSPYPQKLNRAFSLTQNVAWMQHLYVLVFQQNRSLIHVI